MTLAEYVEAHKIWSERTFGDGSRHMGITKHLEKEIVEIRENPTDLMEWIDVMILAIDGYWRAGGEPHDLLPMLCAKQKRNFNRQWPATTSQDEPVEHVR